MALIKESERCIVGYDAVTRKFSVWHQIKDIQEKKSNTLPLFVTEDKLAETIRTFIADWKSYKEYMRLK